MTWFDLLAAVLVLGYLLLGAWTGVVRRAIGFVTVYAACFAATAVGAAAVPQLEAVHAVQLPDAHIWLFFGTLLVIVAVVEIVAGLYHEQLQLTYVAVDRLTGALAGLATGLVVATLLWGLMLAAGSPIGGSSTPMQVSLRAATSASVFGRTAAKPLLPPFQAAFAPVLPRDPQQYFGSATT